MQYITNFLILARDFSPAMALRSNSAFESTDQYQYAAPVDIPMLLSGNYGEIRSTHFHSGIDIKTEQVEGKNITAAQEGYVFRIVVNSGGYGRALYLRHPNGQVTVYAHMQVCACPRGICSDKTNTILLRLKLICIFRHRINLCLIKAIILD